MPAVFPSIPDAAYTFIQMSPSATWHITHGLNKKPSVTVIDSAGSLVAGEVVYTDDNSLVVSFSGGFSGEAHCN